MPKPIIRGTLQPVRTGFRTRFDPASGLIVTEEFSSAGDNLRGLAAQFERSGIPYEHLSNPVRSTLSVNRSGSPYQAEEPLERWEAFSNQVQLDIREHPNSVALGQELLARVTKDVKRHEDGRAVDTDSYASANATALFNLMIRGVTTYPVAQWVLRYTANVSNSYQFVTEANSGIGTIYTMSQVTTSVPAGRLRSTLQSIEAPAADAMLTYGWLKVSYSEVQTARSRVDVSSEYWLGQWANFIYL